MFQKFIASFFRSLYTKVDPATFFQTKWRTILAEKPILYRGDLVTAQQTIQLLKSNC